MMLNIRSAKRTLVLGIGPLITDLLIEIERRPSCEYDVVGIVVPSGSDEVERHSFPLLGTVDELHQIIHDKNPEVVIVALFSDKKGLFDHQVLDAGLLRNIRIEHAPAVYEKLTGKLPIEAYSLEDVVYSDTFQPDRVSLLCARLMSLSVAIVGSVTFAPLLLLIAIVIKLDSRGPVLFVQQRSGFRGRRFNLFKFRTMYPSTQKTSEWEGDNTERITRVGYWLRKFRLDEIPQFFNIIKGDMNLVGPRPHPVSNFELMVLTSRNLPESGSEIPYYFLRSRVLPGITGWAQVRYRYANNLKEEIEKLHFDLYYIKHYSFLLDFRILLETVRTVFAGNGVTGRSSEITSSRISRSEQEPSYERT